MRNPEPKYAVVGSM
jgi:hypothetical protein